MLNASRGAEKYAFAESSNLLFQSDVYDLQQSDKHLVQLQNAHAFSIFNLQSFIDYNIDLKNRTKNTKYKCLRSKRNTSFFSNYFCLWIGSSFQALFKFIYLIIGTCKYLISRWSKIVYSSQFAKLILMITRGLKTKEAPC